MTGLAPYADALHPALPADQEAGLAPRVSDHVPGYSDGLRHERRRQRAAKTGAQRRLQRLVAAGFANRAPLHNGGLYVVDADGSGLRNLARIGFDSTWSPDGRQIDQTHTAGTDACAEHMLNRFLCSLELKEHS